MNTITKTSIDNVRTHLNAGKSISPGTAMLVYGILRLASAVEDLRNEGMEIDMVMKTDEAGKRYGEYKLRRNISIGDTVQVRRGHGWGIPKWVRKTKAAKVVGRALDVASVQFTRGTRLDIVQMNVRELVHAA